MGRTKKAPPSAIPGILSLLGFVLFLSLPTLVKIGANDVTLKVGGTESARVMYQVGGQAQVGLGSTELPWEFNRTWGSSTDPSKSSPSPKGLTTAPGARSGSATNSAIERRMATVAAADSVSSFWSETPNCQRSQRTSVR